MLFLFIFYSEIQGGYCAPGADVSFEVLNGEYFLLFAVEFLQKTENSEEFASSLKTKKGAESMENFFELVLVVVGKGFYPNSQSVTI